MQVEFHLIAKIQLTILSIQVIPKKIVNKPKEIKTLGLRLKDDLDKLKINPEIILQNGEEDVPPWTYNSPAININLSNLKKSHQIHLNISKKTF
jgi:hypothetical protein